MPAKIKRQWLVLTSVGILLLLATLYIVLFDYKGTQHLDNPLSSPFPAYENTVFTVTSVTGESYIARIADTITNEDPPRYLANHRFENNNIEVGYQYIGKGFVANTSIIDVFLVSVVINNEVPQFLSVIYEGGNHVVWDQNGLKIAFNQK